VHLVIHEQSLDQEIGAADQVLAAHPPRGWELREALEARLCSGEKGPLPRGHFSRARATGAALGKEELHQHEGRLEVRTLAGAEFFQGNFGDLQDMSRVKIPNEPNGNRCAAPGAGAFQQQICEVRALNLSPNFPGQGARPAHLQGGAVVRGRGQVRRELGRI